MALTGIPLIALCLLLTAAAGAATVVLWSRFGRWRLVSRPIGLVLCECLVVLSAGLAANRHEQFYPSWQALAGDTGTATRTAGRAAGLLDGSFSPGRLTLAWHPAGSAGWHLASPAQVSVPRAYLGGDHSYPVLLALGGRPDPAGLGRVTVDPGRHTGAASLAGLTGLLSADLRVTAHSWALVTSAACAPLAGRLIRAYPGRFATLAVVGGRSQTVLAPAGVTVATTSAAPAARPAAKIRAGLPVARPTGLRTRAHRPHRAASTVLTGSWAAATAWAAEQTPLPLAPPEVLPKGAPE
jgi:hypothetical protein